MKKINHYRVEIIKDSTQNKFEHRVLNVLLENEDYIVIDTFNFQSLRISGKDKELDKAIIFEMNYNYARMDGIYYNFYSYEGRSAKQIKRDIENWITKKYGYLYRVNLDFIK